MTIDLTAVRLVRGTHATRETDPAVMEAVAWLAGEPHANHPASTSPVVASFCRLVNDLVDDEERQRLVAYVPRLVGMKAALDVELRRTLILADWAVRTAAATALRTAGLWADAERLAQVPPVTDIDSARRAARASLAAEETATRAAVDAAKAERAATRATWVSKTEERVRAVERAQRAAVLLEAARDAAAEAMEATEAAAAAWLSRSNAEATAQATTAVGAAVGAWAAAVHAAVQLSEAPLDWAVPLEEMLIVS